MKRFLSLLWVSALCIGMVSAATGGLRETRPVKITESFDGVSASAGVDVVYTQSTGTPVIELSATSDVIDKIWVRVQNGILKVSYQAKTGVLSFNKSHRAELRITGPALHSFEASSSSDIVLKLGMETDKKVSLSASSSGEIHVSTLQCGDLDVKASSSGDIDIARLKCVNLSIAASSKGDVEIKNLKAKQVIADTASASDIELEGTTDTFAAEASSAGNIDAEDLKADVVVAEASSAGKIECRAVKALEAKCSSAGQVVYSGNPNIIGQKPKGLRKNRDD